MAIKHLIQHAQHQLKSLHTRIQQLSAQAKAAKEAELHPHHGARAAEAAVQRVQLEISAVTTAKVMLIVLLFFGAVKFLAFISDILLIFFVSILFAAALDPMVDYMQKRKIPRPLGVIIVYIIVLSVIGLFISQLIPLLANEISELALRIQDLIKNIVSGKIALPRLFEGIGPALRELFEGVDISKVENYKDVLLKFAQNLSSAAGSLVHTLIIVFNGLLNAVLVFVLTFLMIVDETGIDRFLLSLFPSRHADYIMEKNHAVKKKIGDWLRGQMLLAFCMGFLTYIGLFIVGLFTQPIDFMLTLGMFAVIAEFLPVIGPLLTWFATVLIVSSQSAWMVLWVTLLFILIQQIEGNILIPVIMRKAVGLSPIFVVFAVLVGLKFFGILGIILAVPVAATVAIFVKDYALKAK